MLKLYNKEHEAIGVLTNLKDYKVEYVLSGEDLVEFSLSISDENIHLVEEEGYVRNKSNEYVIKAIDPSDNFKRFTCNVNVEDLVGKAIASFDTSNNNINDTIRLAIAGTGWILADNNINKRRTVRLTNTNALEVLREVRKVFSVDFRYDAINKKIYVYEKFGEDKGVYFSDELNIKSLSIPSDTYDYVTRLYPYGKDGLTIAEINNGKEYIENFQYSNKIIELIWQDNRYTDVNSLKEDAEAKLEELSKPNRSYQASVTDLAKQSKEYSYLDFFLGDTVTLLSKSEKFRDKQRIVKYIEYPDNPSENTCELGNTILTFEELQQENEYKNQTVDNITTGNGIINGEAIDGISTEQIYDFEAEVAKITDLTVINADITNLKAENVTITGKLSAIEGEFGTLKANVATIEELTVTHSASINDLQANKADITDLTATNIKFDVASGGTLDLQTLLSKFVTGENGQFINISSSNSVIANATIKNAMIESLSVDKLLAGRISTNKFTVSSDDGGIEIVGATQQFKDKNNKVRIQMGQDTQGNFNFILRGEDGTTTLIDHNGIKEKAIADDLIKENMVAEDAIGEKQINYSSLVTGLNKDTNTQLIKASKVAIDLTGQSLEVSFNSLKSNVDGLDDKIESNTTAITVAQGKIEGLISENSIITGDVTTISDKYTSLKATVDGINTTVASHTSSIGTISTDLATANALADSKAKVFTSTPTTPYKVGDLWVQGTSGDVMRCKTARSSGSYTASDWEKASKYTDDTKANAVDGKVTNLQTEYNKTKSQVAEIVTDLDGITQRVSNTESTTATITADLQTVSDVANSANTNASSALNKANTATSTATTAKNTADSALTQANTNKGNITTLQGTVNTTNSKVATLETNLNGITQRVSSTESTTATLTTKVNGVESTANTAKSTADSAKTTATNAQSTANTANSNATSALNKANNALQKKMGINLIVNQGTYAPNQPNKEGELYIHGFDANGNKADVDGYIINPNNGSKLTVPKGMINANDKIPYNQEIYLCYSNRLWFAWYNASDKKWKYLDANANSYEGTVNNLVWGDSHLVLGVVVASGAEMYTSGFLYDTPKNYRDAVGQTLEFTTTKSQVSTIETNLSGITSRVGTVESKTTTLEGKVSSQETRLKTAEQKITDSAIISTVTSSTTYKNDLNGKVSTNKIISSINQTAETIKIQASKIQLEGTTTIAGSSGDKIRINNSDYEILNGSTSKAFFGLRQIDDNRLVPRLALSHSGLNSTNNNYFVMTAHDRTNNPLGTSSSYVDLAYRCQEFKLSDNTGDVSNIRMISNGDVQIAAIREVVIRSNYKNGAYVNTGAEYNIGKFSSSGSAYFDGNLQIDCVRNIVDRENGLVLADYGKGSDKATVIRIATDSSGTKFVRPVDTKKDIRLGSPSNAWYNIYTSVGTYSSLGILSDDIETLSTKSISRSNDDILDGINFFREARTLSEDSSLQMDVTSILNTCYVEKDIEEGETYINLHEMVKLLIYEVKKLKESNINY